VVARVAQWSEQRWLALAALRLSTATKGPVHVKITVVVQNNNGDNFQWYFSKEQSFNGIFLKM
jgi:hypothetical protein